MKRVKLFYAVPLLLASVVVIQACKKSFLDKKPLGALSASVISNKQGVEGLLIGAYHQLGGSQNWGSAPSNWVFGSVAADESYKGSTPSDQPAISPIESWAYNANNNYFNEAWTSRYNGIGRANETIRAVPLASDLSASDGARIIAEARFLRGFYHFELKKMFNNIPYVDENVTVDNANTNVTNIDASGNFIDIWPMIEGDFMTAATDLPETLGQAGRANKWAAKAYLAKVYMFQHKYAAAKTLFDEIIANGKTTNGKKYALINYFSNFNPQEENSAESIFAFQASVNDGSGTNGNYGDNLNYPNSGGPGGCCGFFNPSITMANAYKTGADGLPMFATYNTGSLVSIGATPYSGPLDPRVDLVMGRPGKPYLDWGNVPTDLAWIRDPGADGVFSPKKSVYALGQQGLVSTETSFWGPTQMDAGNVNLMRYSDVLLLAAEAEAEAGTLAQALIYVNMVRMRAADPTGWVYKNSIYDPATAKYKTQTTPADNYKINPYPSFTDKDYALMAIRYERFLELSQEGHRFFDLQRLDKGTGLMASILNAYANAEKSRPGFFADNPTAMFEQGKDEYFPLPQQQVDQANSYGPVVLKQNP